MHSAEIQFKNGMSGRLCYPDFYTLLVGAGDVPDQDVLATIELLRGEGSLPKQNLIERVQGDIRHYTRLYRLAALCLETPKLVLMRRRCNACPHIWDGEQKTCDHCMGTDTTVIYERSDGEISPRDLTFLDLIAIQQDFFWSAAATITPAAAQDVGGVAEPTRASGDVQDDASEADGD